MSLAKTPTPPMHTRTAVAQRAAGATDVAGAGLRAPLGMAAGASGRPGVARIIVKRPMTGGLGGVGGAGGGMAGGGVTDGSKRVRLVLQRHRQSGGVGGRGGTDSAADGTDSDASAGGRMQGQGRGKGMAMLHQQQVQQRTKMSGASRQV